MENEQLDNNLVNGAVGKPERPQFLKVLCILSFISCGIWIVLFGIGTSCLSISEDKVTEIWDQAMAKQPDPSLFKGIDPVHFFHEIGLLCAYSTLINILSLIGVMMMWRLNKIGFIIYIVAELAGKFTGYMVDLGPIGEGSGAQMIFWIIMDLVFIGMYAANLKAMNKGNQQAVS
jgi:hypothetical protein